MVTIAGKAVYKKGTISQNMYRQIFLEKSLVKMSNTGSLRLPILEVEMTISFWDDFLPLVELSYV